MFGNTIYFGKIPEADWVSNICSRFNNAGITISEGHAEDIIILRVFSNALLL